MSLSRAGVSTGAELTPALDGGCRTNPGRGPGRQRQSRPAACGLAPGRLYGGGGSIRERLHWRDQQREGDSAGLCDSLDDEEERRVTLLLLGKAAVLAHRYERPLAAELDDERERRSRLLLL